MRVCLDVRKLHDSGIGTYIRGLLGGFSVSDYNLQWEFIARTNDLISPILRAANARIHPCQARNYSLAEFFALGKITIKTRPDVYHAPHYVFPIALKVPLVVTVHDLIHLKFPQYFPGHKRAYARWMLKRVGKKAAAVLTVSERTKRDLVVDLGFDESKITVCYNGVSEKFFRRIADSEKDRFLQSHGLPRDYLLYAGNFKPHKNVSGLIEAWAKLPDSIRPPLVLFGDHIDQYEELARKVQDLNRAGEVFFPSWISEDEMPTAYQCAAAYIQPSWYEGFGLPVIEAMASGTPSAVSDRGSLPEIAGDAALTFDPADLTQFIQALEKILTDDALRQTLISKGMDKTAEFTWGKTAQKTYNIYKGVMES